ncbi:hypothetical protein ACFVIM_06185 [Streptomyces sp. NPDC057638]|uniref:hypothetical protein n=1 Tax=Streptomyces sp. NPDC057638 TaxID=3346190 RepID=UPI0036836229
MTNPKNPDTGPLPPTARAVVRTLALTLSGLAAAGCVSVDPVPPTSAPPRQSPPPPRSAQQLTQGPAQETLGSGTPAPSATRRDATTEPHHRHGRTDGGDGGGELPRAPWSQRDRVPAPRTPARPPLDGADPCALGERHGSWSADSVQSQICREIYRRARG